MMRLPGTVNRARRGGTEDSCSSSSGHRGAGISGGRACACIGVVGVLLSWSLAAAAADDETLDVAPLRATVPVAAADVDGSTLFRAVDSGTLNRSNSALPVAADEGLWRRSKGLPIGDRIRLHVSEAKLPADGHSLVHLTVTLFDAHSQPITDITRVRVETRAGYGHCRRSPGRDRNRPDPPPRQDSRGHRSGARRAPRLRADRSLTQNAPTHCLI